MRYIARASYGNDSIAMLQVMKEFGLRDVAVTYSDTGWAAPDWLKRVEAGEQWVRNAGWIPYRILSVGFEQNVLDQTEKGMFPTRLRKYCTKYLKIHPFLKWAKEHDPKSTAVVCVGVRRAESEQRKHAAAFMPEFDNGRHVWHPIVEFDDASRDALVDRAGFEILKHRSDECAICINATRTDLRRAPTEHVARVSALEARVGRPMFNPAKYMGATGINEVKRWAEAERGQYQPQDLFALSDPVDLFAENDSTSCDDGWCGL